MISKRWILFVCVGAIFLCSCTANEREEGKREYQNLLLSIPRDQIQWQEKGHFGRRLEFPEQEVIIKCPKLLAYVALSQQEVDSSNLQIRSGVFLPSLFWTGRKNGMPYPVRVSEIEEVFETCPMKATELEALRKMHFDLITNYVEYPEPFSKEEQDKRLKYYSESYDAIRFQMINSKLWPGYGTDQKLKDLIRVEKNLEMREVWKQLLAKLFFLDENYPELKKFLNTLSPKQIIYGGMDLKGYQSVSVNNGVSVSKVLNYLAAKEKLDEKVRSIKSLEDYQKCFVTPQNGEPVKTDDPKPQDFYSDIYDQFPAALANGYRNSYTSEDGYIPFDGLRTERHQLYKKGIEFLLKSGNPKWIPDVFNLMADFTLELLPSGNVLEAEMAKRVVEFVNDKKSEQFLSFDAESKSVRNNLSSGREVYRLLDNGWLFIIIDHRFENNANYFMIIDTRPKTWKILHEFKMAYGLRC